MSACPHTGSADKCRCADVEREQRAEQLMAKGPVWLVRRVMELEAERERALITLGEVVQGEHDGALRAVRKAMEETWGNRSPT